MTYVYKLTCRINNRNYIGVTNNPQNRWRQHKYGHNRKVKITQAIKKYGWENFDATIIDQHENRDYVFRVLEPKYIQQYAACTEGYNSSPGGAYSPPLMSVRTETHRNRLSLALKGRYLSAQHKQKISVACQGKPKLWKRGPISAAQKDKQRIAMTNKPSPKKGRPVGQSLYLIAISATQMVCVGSLTKFARNHGLNPGHLWTTWKTKRSLHGFRVLLNRQTL